MFQFSPECSRQDPFPFSSGKKTSKWKCSKWDLMFCRGVQGGGRQVIIGPNGAERFSGMSCPEPGCEWGPLFPIDLRSWQVGPSQCEVGSRRTKRAHTGGSRVRMRRWRRRWGGADWEPAFTQLHHCVLSYRSPGAPHTYISGSLSPRAGVVVWAPWMAHNKRRREAGSEHKWATVGF